MRRRTSEVFSVNASPRCRSATMSRGLPYREEQPGKRETAAIVGGRCSAPRLGRGEGPPERRGDALWEAAAAACIARALATEPQVRLLDSARRWILSHRAGVSSCTSFAGTDRYLDTNMRVARVSDKRHLYQRRDDRGGTTRALFTTPADSRTEAYITGRFG